MEYIITRPVFSNLLDYVIDNGRTKNSKAVITVAYKKLIDEFYDIEMNDLKAEQLFGYEISQEKRYGYGKKFMGAVW